MLRVSMMGCRPAGLVCQVRCVQDAVKVSKPKVSKTPKTLVDKELAAKLKECGPTRARNVFVSQLTKGTKGRLDFKKIQDEWLKQTEAQKEEFAAIAKVNFEKKKAIMESCGLKKPQKSQKPQESQEPQKPQNEKRRLSKYALYTKEHFSSFYQEELNNGTAKKDAFANATRALSRQYKAEKAKADAKEAEVKKAVRK
eukprot:TRINITY_DN377_c0_g1_i2.p1 TRINITY_DN377_c0_g1~~TRINITY_DN377_c0_g1_i2.p1  ORF type:complete len:198 (+),score=74.60 TRINITY_DN377_c0_g1_i2:110-703(+)